MTTWAMIDLETLGTTPDAQILTIGGFKFDPFTWDEPHSVFNYRFDLADQDQIGRVIDQRTIDEFWDKQPKEVIEEAFSPENRKGSREIMKALKKWYVGCDAVWSQGELDTVMIEHLCRQLGEPVPWAFWAVENLRTLLNRMPTDPRKDFVFKAHDPVEDCRAQIHALRTAFEHFGMKK